MSPRDLQAAIEDEELFPHVRSEETCSRDTETIEERTRTILGPFVQALPSQSVMENADYHSGMPLPQVRNPIDYQPAIPGGITLEDIDYFGLPYRRDLRLTRQEAPSSDFPSGYFQQGSHFDEAYETSLATAAAVAERDPPVPVPASSPLARWFGDLTATAPLETSDGAGDMALGEADKLDSSSASVQVLAPAPHLVLPFNISRIESAALALEYTQPASPADREMGGSTPWNSPVESLRPLPLPPVPTWTPAPLPPSYCGQDSEMKMEEEKEEEEEEVSSPSPLPPLQRYPTMYINKEEEEEEDDDDNEMDEMSSSQTLCQSPSSYSATLNEEEQVGTVKVEVETTAEEITVRIEADANVKLSLNVNFEEQELQLELELELEPEPEPETIAPGPASAPAAIEVVPAPESASGDTDSDSDSDTDSDTDTAGAEAGPMIRKRSHSGWTSINGNEPDAKRRRFL
ncbi:hypothetical protein V8F20_004853 [Naviculisporaceae sp. PSN 640]